MTNPLFTPLQLGSLTLKNRILMAPLTRCRAEDDHVPGDLIADYYAQRDTIQCAETNSFYFKCERERREQRFDHI